MNESDRMALVSFIGDGLQFYYNRRARQFPAISARDLTRLGSGRRDPQIRGQMNSNFARCLTTGAGGW